jgi:ferritin-like metal-binding protein YciE
VDLRDVFLNELGEMLEVERTLAEDVLPDVFVQARNQQLRDAIQEHTAQTQEHVARVEQVFSELGEKPRTARSHGLEGLRRQHEESLGGVAGLSLRDLIHAAAAADAEHYEISGYRSLIMAAELLGEPESVRLLEQNLHEEEEALEKLEKSIPEKLGEELVPA